MNNFEKRRVILMDVVTFLIFATSVLAAFLIGESVGEFKESQKKREATSTITYKAKNKQTKK